MTPVVRSRADTAKFLQSESERYAAVIKARGIKVMLPHLAGRPVGVQFDGRGALLVADDVGNVVWRVTPAAPPA